MRKTLSQSVNDPALDEAVSTYINRKAEAETAKALSADELIVLHTSPVHSN